MNVRNLVMVLGVTAVGVALIKRYADPTGAGAGGQAKPDPSPVVSVVEETLHQHEGEDNPIVHAFEEALEHKHGDAAA